MSIEYKIKSGIFWVSLSTFFTKLTNITVKLLLARLLEPAEFGIIALLILVLEAFSIFSDFGLGKALIYQNEKTKNKAANTSFFLFPLSATLLFSTTYISAPSIASFFNEPELELAIKVIAFTIPITSLGSVPATLLQKELKFKTRVIPEIVPAFCYAITTIILLIFGFGIWSVVYGRIILALVSNLLFWKVAKWTPSFDFDFETAKELIGYAKHLFLASFVTFLIINSDDLIIGKMLSASDLGLYSIAYTIANFSSSHIAQLTNIVMFPAYSKIYNNTRILEITFLKTLNYVATFSIPAAFGICILSSEIISLFLGDKWLNTTTTLQILAFSCLIDAFSPIYNSLFQATGHPDIVKKTFYCKLAVILITIIPLTSKYGIEGTATSMLLAGISQLLYLMTYAVEVENMNFENLIRVFGYPFMNSLIMVLTILLLKKYMHITPIIDLLVLITSGLIVYICMTMYNNKYIKREIKSVLLKK